MEKLPVAGSGFQGVPDGMTEVKHGAPIVLALVGFDNPRLDRTGLEDDLTKQLAIRLDDVFHLLFQ